MPTWLNDRAFTVTSLRSRSCGLDVVRHPERLRGDGQPGIDGSRRRKERRVDDEEILDVVRAAERIEHRRARVVAEDERAALMRRVPHADRVREHFRRPVAEAPEDPRSSSTSLACARRLFGRYSRTMRPSGASVTRFSTLRQIFGHRQPVGGARHPRLVRPERNVPQLDALVNPRVADALAMTACVRPCDWICPSGNGVSGPRR